MNLKTFFGMLSIVLVPILTFAQQNKFVLDGKLLSDSAIGGYIYMSYHNKGNLVTDTRDSSLIRNNTYHFEGEMIDGGTRIVIHWHGRPMKLDTGRDQARSMVVYISAGDHASVLHTADFHNIQISGSLIQAETDSIHHELSLRQRPPDKIIEDFIRHHPSSWMSYLMLDEEVSRHMISPASSVELYEVFTPSLKKYEYVQKLGANIALLGDQTKKNVPAKDFTVTDTNGHPVSLSSFRGKYTLLDFWASWCGPCRAENPNLTKAYNTYKDKNFTILSVSLDQSREAWMDAVKKDHLTWTQASDLKGMTSPVATLYNISAIPANFLIDPSGKIITSNLRGEELNRKLAEIFSSGTGSNDHKNIGSSSSKAQTSTARTQQNQFSLEGRIDSDKPLTGMIQLQYEDDEAGKRDSCPIVNNTYHFSGVMQDGAIRANLFWKQPTDGIHFSGFAQFYVAPGKTTIVHTARFNTFDVPGSAIQADNQRLNQLKNKRDEFYVDSIRSFIRLHPDSWLSYVALEELVRYHEINENSAVAVYAQLSPTLRTYNQPGQLEAKITGMVKTLAGQPSIDFTESDTSGKQVTLSSFKGKYVLVKFWASWCHPCRAENKVLTPIYHKYKDKGFEVLGVSLDNEVGKKAWLKAIKDDGTDWTQICDFKGAQNDAAVKYGVIVVPTSFLIDPKGKIIAKNLMGEPLDKKLQELLN